LEKRGACTVTRIPGTALEATRPTIFVMTSFSKCTVSLFQDLANLLVIDEFERQAINKHVAKAGMAPRVTFATV